MKTFISAKSESLEFDLLKEQICYRLADQEYRVAMPLPRRVFKRFITSENMWTKKNKIVTILSVTWLVKKNNIVTKCDMFGGRYI